MAGTGPTAKPADQRRRRNKEVRQEVVAPVGGPILRPFPGSRDGQDVRVLAWWDAWSDLDEVAAWKATDWVRCADLLPLVRMYYQASDEGESTRAVKLFAEIRQNCSLLGATVADRLRNKVDVKRAAAPSPVEPRRRMHVVDNNAAG